MDPLNRMTPMQAEAIYMKIELYNIDRNTYKYINILIGRKRMDPLNRMAPMQAEAIYI